MSFCVVSAADLPVALAVEAAERALVPEKAFERYAHVNPQACQYLWRAVLVQAWMDALAPARSVDELARRRARNWFGSRAFERVCQSAGVDPDAVMTQFRAARGQVDYRPLRVFKKRG